MAPDLNKKLEDEVEKYRQTQTGKCFLLKIFIFRNENQRVFL